MPKILPSKTILETYFAMKITFKELVQLKTLTGGWK